MQGRKCWRVAAASPRAPHEAGRAAGWWISPRYPRRLFAKLLETSPKLAMDVAAAALPAFVALWLLSPWPLLGSVQGQFSAGEWSVVGGIWGLWLSSTLDSEGGGTSWLPGLGIREVFARGGGCRLKPGLSWEFVSGGTRSGGGRHPAQVTFTFATHCFRGWPGTQTAPGILYGVCGDLAFLG